MPTQETDLLEHRYPIFFTATILNWQKLLAPQKYKILMLDSLRFLVEKNRIQVYAFVLMPNHIHLLWRILYLCWCLSEATPTKTHAHSRNRFTGTPLPYFFYGYDFELAKIISSSKIQNLDAG